MKLEKWALIAEIISGAAIVITLIFLILEVRAGTQATLAANRQSLAGRTEAFLLTAAASPEISRVRAKVANRAELTDEEYYHFSAYTAAALRLAEEAYLQYQDGQLDEEYWLTRGQNLVNTRLESAVAREMWSEWKERGNITQEFSDWLDHAVEERYGQ